MVNGDCVHRMQQQRKPSLTPYVLRSILEGHLMPESEIMFRHRVPEALSTIQVW